MLGPALLPPPSTGGDVGRLDRLVEGWWSTEATGRGTVVPDGAVDLLWVPGQVPVLAGPDVEPRPVDLAAGTTLVGLRLRPGVAGAVLDDGVDRALGQRVPLDAVLASSELDRLLDELGRGPADAAAAETLALAIGRRVATDWRPDPVVGAAVDSIRAGTELDPAEIGSRQLRRRFTAAIGYGPAFLRRIVRLDRFTDLLAAEPDRPLAELAVAAGYFDQAHLGRDCRRLLDTTPGELRRRR